MQTPSILKVLNVEERYDSRVNDEQPEGRLYKYIQVETIGDKVLDVPGVGRMTVKGEKRRSAFTAYPNNYLDQPDPGSDLKKGDLVMGDIVTREVPPYDLVGNDGIRRTITQYSSVVLGDSTKEEQFEALVRRTFARRGHPITPPVEVTDEQLIEAAERNGVEVPEEIENDLEVEETVIEDSEEDAL